MKRHEKPQTQKLVTKVKIKAPIQFKGENPIIEEVVNQSIQTRKILVPIRKKSSNQPFNPVKSQRISFEPEKCKFCKAAFMKKGEMRRHIAGAHEGKKPYECHIHQSVLQSPMKGLDIKEKPLEINEKSLEIDEEPLEIDEKIDNKLPTDGDVFKISFEPEKCKFCNATFMKKGEMKRHIAGAHEGKKPYECHICNECFLINSKRLKHIATVHDGKNQLFKCSSCDITFSEKRLLKRHNKSFHGSKKPNICSICETKFVLWSHLKLHFQMVHEKKKQESKVFDQAIEDVIENCDDKVKDQQDFAAHEQKKALEIKEETYKMVDNLIGRLDSDLAKFETEIKEQEPINGMFLEW